MPLSISSPIFYIYNALNFLIVAELYEKQSYVHEHASYLREIY